MIAARDEQKAHAISNSVCRSFRDYTRDPKVFDAARHELLLEASKS